MVCTARPLPVDRSMTAAQGPQGQTNLTVVLAAHSGVPGRPRTPDSKQAHRRQGKKIGVTGDARNHPPFSRPRRERASAQRTQGQTEVMGGSVTELALDECQRYTFASHLDGVGAGAAIADAAPRCAA